MKLAITANFFAPTSTSIIYSFLSLLLSMFAQKRYSLLRCVWSRYVRMKNKKTVIHCSSRMQNWSSYQTNKNNIGGEGEAATISPLKNISIFNFYSHLWRERILFSPPTKALPPRSKHKKSIKMWKKERHYLVVISFSLCTYGIFWQHMMHVHFVPLVLCGFTMVNNCWSNN